MATVTIVGTGYVGLVTGAGFADVGHHVVCVDIDAHKVEQLQSGRLPIFEVGLDDLVERGVEAGRLAFQLGHDETSLLSEFYFLCLPTPEGDDGSADLSYLLAAVDEIADLLPPGAVLVTKSTVPVGTTVLVEQALGRGDVKVVSNPEFLREGSAVSDFMRPDRLVIGGSDQASCERVAALYSSIESDVLLTDGPSAEMVKYAANAFLATKLSFINAIAAVCEGVGADIHAVRKGIGQDHRIGPHFLHPGPGWGGSCFPKDIHALLRIADKAGYDFDLLRSVVASNDDQFDRVVRKIEQAVGRPLAGCRVGLLGLAFKAGTDDTRMSPALAIAQRLLDLGALLTAYDPVARTEVDGIAQVSDPYTVCDGADVVVTLTEWPEFASLDLAKVKSLMTGDVIVDTRSIISSDTTDLRVLT